MTKVKYDESSMQHHEGLEGIRVRPTMYIGLIGSAGVMHLFREGIDNSFDEAKAGYCDNIFVYIDQKKKQFMIQDNGRGIPIGTLRDTLSKIHMGGKFDGGAYRYSSGLNGVGTKAINALSLDFTAKVKRDGKEVSVKFKQGKLVEDTKEIGKVKKDDTGTTIIWTPDPSVLENFEVNPEPYMEFCENSSFLIPNVKIEFNFKKEDGKMIKKTYLSKDGLMGYVNSIVKTPLIKPFKLEMEKVYEKEININFDDSKSDNKTIKVKIGTEMDVYLTYVKKTGENIISFANGIQTKEGGTHETGCKMGLTKVINKYINDNKLKNKREEKLEITGEDCRDGLVLVINSRISDPKYDSQTKEKITNTELMSLGNSIMTEKLTEFFNKNPKEAKAICLKAIAAAKGRLAAENAKTAVVKKNESIFSALSSISKFEDCESTDPTKKVLFIVEGKRLNCSH